MTDKFEDGPPCGHNDMGYECFECGTRRHAGMHPKPVDDCLTCKLATVRIYGRFTGPSSMSDATQEFWHTGDPAVFDRQEQEAGLARMKDPLKVTGLSPLDLIEAAL